MDFCPYNFYVSHIYSDSCEPKSGCYFDGGKLTSAGFGQNMHPTKHNRSENQSGHNAS